MSQGLSQSWRRLWIVIGVSFAFALLTAESCGTGSPTSSKQTCFNLPALDTSSCSASGSRNECRDTSWNDLIDVCTGTECTSCNR